VTFTDPAAGTVSVADAVAVAVTVADAVIDAVAITALQPQCQACLGRGCSAAVAIPVATPPSHVAKSAAVATSYMR
jgi:hypothetical protein